MLAVLEERKGHRFLLDAARVLKDRGRKIQYVFAGDGSHKTQLQSLVQTLGLREEVSFVGFVKDVPRFLSSIDVLVLPSLYEGLGVAALEGMAAGKPVVATRVGGLAESIVDAAQECRRPGRRYRKASCRFGAGASDGTERGGAGSESFYYRADGNSERSLLLRIARRHTVKVFGERLLHVRQRAISGDFKQLSQSEFARGRRSHARPLYLGRG